MVANYVSMSQVRDSNPKLGIIPSVGRNMSTKLTWELNTEASGQKNPNRTPQVNNLTCLTCLISYIPPTPAKREPTGQRKVYSSKSGVNGKEIRKETFFWHNDSGIGLSLEKRESFSNSLPH
ncbi:hypothetical protein TNCV_3721071 [Trichonephila clavipes]|nr:hypothetical protein TNCV_3721071 [Trichonephila clavipes]